MQRYRHYSFDLWQTLIRSNVDFRENRAKWLTSNFNPRKLSKEEVLAITSDVAKMCDQITEASQFSIQPLQMYAMVLYRLGFDITQMQQRDLISILNIMDTQFKSATPFIYDDETLTVLSVLKGDGATISITSNTGFIPGATLEYFLAKCGIGQYIDFCLFSDQVGFCKPSYTMYTQMCSRANHINEVRGRGVLLPRDILHVGDNFKTDILGAEAAGLQSFQVHGTTGNSLKNLL